MTTSSDSRPPSDRINDVASILQSLQRAVREALLEHKRAGNPIAVWRDGKVEWIKPEDISVDDIAPEQIGPAPPREDH